ncbi:hypothetical protein LguiA_027843 [Lonicera macranthoides]
MGNAAASCAPSIISAGVVKVLLLDGRLEIYTRPIKAAELMLENQLQFVCDSANLKVGQRVQGLSADEELERRKLYFLLPMEMLYSVLTIEEMDSLTNKVSKGLKQGSLNFAKIFPVLGEFCMFPNSEAKMRDERGDSDSIREGSGERYSRQRSWTPALETIVETPTPPHNRKELCREFEFIHENDGMEALKKLFGSSDLFYRAR